MPEQTSDPWRIIWRFATSDSALVILLLALAVSVTLTIWIPQRPLTDADYARWLAQVQARFGEATSVMTMLGVFNLTDSLGFRALLALLFACLLLRLIEGVEQLRQGREIVEPRARWREISGQNLLELLDDLRRHRYRTIDGSSFHLVDRWPWADVSLLTAHTGALVLLVGLLLSRLWGWQVDGLILQGGQRSSLTDANHSVTLTQEGNGISHSPGVVTFVEKRGPGVRVRALDDEGQALQLQLTAEAEPALDLLVALTEDRYFAVPAANLIAHLTPRSEEPYTRVDVEVYRSPPGEIITEAVTEEGGEAELTVEGVRLEFEPVPYAQVTVTRNPGRWPSGFGLLLLMGGLTANLMWPRRRFWLREREGVLEAAGHVPRPLLPREEV